MSKRLLVSSLACLVLLSVGLILLKDHYEPRLEQNTVATTQAAFAKASELLLSAHSSGETIPEPGGNITVVKPRDITEQLTQLKQLVRDFPAVLAWGGKGADHPEGADTLVSLAVQYELHEALVLLLDAGASPDIGSAFESPIAYAAGRNDLESMRILIRFRCNIVDPPGGSPAIAAIMKNNIDALRLLFDSGLDPFATVHVGDKRLIPHEPTDLLRFARDDGYGRPRASPEIIQLIEHYRVTKN
jgi:hypothetical protein